MLRMLRTALAFGVGCWLLATAAAADPQPPAPPTPPPADPALLRTQRQISLMEKVIDQTLIESRHALVTGAPNCRGIRLPGYGVLFIVDLSPIVTGDEIAHFRFKDDGSYEVEYEEDAARKKGKRKPIEGRTRTHGNRGSDGSDSEDSDIEYVDDVHDDDNDKDQDKDADKDRDQADKAGKGAASAKTSPGVPPELGDLVEKWKKWDPKTAARLADPERKEVLALVHEELIDVLRDSAHSLTEIAADERIAIAIFPSDLDWRGPGTRTVIEVRRRDVDAYQRGELTAEAFAARVQVENP
jgi:hypothetical protein